MDFAAAGFSHRFEDESVAHGSALVVDEARGMTLLRTRGPNTCVGGSISSRFLSKGTRGPRA